MADFIPNPNGGGGGGGGTPGGSDTQIQFNDGGDFGGDADLTWNKSTNKLSLNDIDAEVSSQVDGTNEWAQFRVGNGPSSADSYFLIYTADGSTGLNIADGGAGSEFYFYGPDGTLGVKQGSGKAYGILDFGQIADTDKTFKLPNYSGTIALLTGDSTTPLLLDNSAFSDVRTLTVPDVDGAIPILTTGDGAPGSTPSAIGLFYLDTTNHKLYVSDGTSNSSDWRILN